MPVKILSKQHFDAITRQSALGVGATDITRMLADGIETDEGNTLVPVVIKNESTIRRHIERRQTEVEGWREKIFGDLQAEPLAWPGFRLKELRRIYNMCMGGAENSRPGADQQKYLNIAKAVLETASRETARLAPREGAKHVHLHGGGEDAVAGLRISLARSLSEMADANVLEETVKVLEPPTTTCASASDSPPARE